MCAKRSRHAQFTTLATALRTGNFQVTRQLIHAGLTPDRGWICEAMRQGHLALAEEFLDLGVQRDIFTMAAVADVNRMSRSLSRVKSDASLTVSMEPASNRVTQ